MRNILKKKYLLGLLLLLVFGSDIGVFNLNAENPGKNINRTTVEKSHLDINAVKNPDKQIKFK